MNQYYRAEAIHTRPNRLLPKHCKNEWPAILVKCLNIAILREHSVCRLVLV